MGQVCQKTQEGTPGNPPGGLGPVSALEAVDFLKIPQQGASSYLIPSEETEAMDQQSHQQEEAGRGHES